MDLLTYLMAKKKKKIFPHKSDLLACLLSKSTWKYFYQTFTGTTLSVDNTVNAPMRIELGASEISQAGTPTPSSPQDIHTISGSNKVVVEGKNLFDGQVELGQYDSTNGTKTNSNANYRNKNYIPILPSTQYTFSINGVSQKYVIYYYKSDKTYVSAELLNSGTFTSPSEVYYVNFRCYNADFTNDFATLKIQLEKGDQATTYELYVSQEAQVNLGDIEYCKIGNYEDKFIRTSGKNLFENTYIQPINANNKNAHLKKGTYTLATCDGQNFGTNIYIELFDSNNSAITTSGHLTSTPSLTFSTISYNYYGGNNYSSITFTIDSDYTLAIGLYQATGTRQVMLVEGEIANRYYEPYGTNEWYIKKNIGKVVLDGTENWDTITDVSGSSGTISQVGLTMSFKTRDGLSNRFTVEANYSATEHIVIAGGLGKLYVQILKTRLSTADITGFKSWLNTNNTELYYILDTPTYTQITGTLAEQLENVYQKMLSYSGQTNISQVNNDLPFVLECEIAMKNY